MPPVFRRLRAWAREVARDATALWPVARDPQTPRAAKIVATYAFSPIALVPDLIRVLGYLDDAAFCP